MLMQHGAGVGLEMQLCSSIKVWMDVNALCG